MEMNDSKFRLIFYIVIKIFMKAIIYYRKSTDRDDKQANSLEHQLANCKRIASVNGFDVFEEIGESKSAKTE